MKEPTKTSAGHLVMNPHHFEISIDDIFRVIRQVETGGHPDPYNAIGSSGELGPYQITVEYFQDALDYDESLYGLDYEGVRDHRTAQLIMTAYWERYAKLPWTPEELCRLHNGGPTKRGTDAYWNKCRGLFH